MVEGISKRVAEATASRRLVATKVGVKIDPLTGVIGWQVIDDL